MFSHKQDMSFDLQGKINLVYPVNPVKKING